MQVSILCPQTNSPHQLLYLSSKNNTAAVIFDISLVTFLNISFAPAWLRCAFCPLATMAVDCYQWCCCYSNNLMPRSPWRQREKYDWLWWALTSLVVWWCWWCSPSVVLGSRKRKTSYSSSSIFPLSLTLTVTEVNVITQSWGLPDVSSHDCRLLLYFGGVFSSKQSRAKVLMHWLYWDCRD